jgi:AAA domain
MGSNPYLEALPRLQSLAELAASLSVLPHFDPAERKLCHVERRYALIRLLSFFAPAARHLRLAEGLDMMIRAGYEDRNPSGVNFKQRARLISQRRRSGQLLFASQQSAAPSYSAALIGAPGMGKSRTVDLTLARYPQVVRHRDMPAQVTWLKLECPKRGSLRSLCTQFFVQLSQVIGTTDYVDLYVNGATSETDLQNLMAVAANLHGIGLLVVDEIQHIGRSVDGEHELVTFLTSLSNQICIPLLMIGTLSVLPRIEHSSRMARRTVGPGSAVWHPLKADAEWNALFERLWQYQWTSSFTKLTDDHRDIFYTCTGGILDLTVKLFVLVQLRLIYRSEIRGTTDESITPGFVQQVASNDLLPVKPMVDALVSGKENQLRRFEDLHSFDRLFNQSIAQLVDAEVAGQLAASAGMTALSAEPAKFEGDGLQIVWSKLRSDGLGDDVIMRLIDAARHEGHDPEKDVLGFYEQVLKFKTRAQRAQVKIRKLKSSCLEEGDLRRLVPEAAQRGRTSFEALREGQLGGILPSAQSEP